MQKRHDEHWSSTLVSKRLYCQGLEATGGWKATCLSAAVYSRGLPEEPVQEATDPHPPVCDVEGDDQSLVQVRVGDPADGREVVQVLRDGDGATPGVDVARRSAPEAFPEGAEHLQQHVVRFRLAHVGPAGGPVVALDLHRPAV